MPQIAKPIPDTPPPRSLQECREFAGLMVDGMPVGLIALGDRRWRLLNLYPIRDVVSGQYKTLKELGGIPQYGWDIFHSRYPEYGMGERTINQMICPQTGRIVPITLRIIVAKARQVGLTMLSILMMIDDMLFANRPYHGGIANYTEDECQKTIDEKVHGVRNNSIWLQFRGVVNVSKNAFAIMKGGDAYASIRVEQGPRGQNPDSGIITEFGKTSAREIGKAQEQRETWFAAGEHKPLIIESTSFGPAGDYYNLCQLARQQQLSGAGLDRKSFDLHFIGWHAKPQNVVEKSVHEMRPLYEEHFADVEKDTGAPLTNEQKNWWTSTLINDFQGDVVRMRHEHPGIYSDFFSADNDSFVMAEQMRTMKTEERITSLPKKPHGCIVAFDLGKTDHTAYVAAQLCGDFIHIIDAYKEKNVDITHFIERIRQQPYTVSMFVLPFDAGIKNEVARHLTGQSDMAVETFFRNSGIHNIFVLRKPSNPAAGIICARRFAADVKIDAKLGMLISDLTSVRKNLDKTTKTYLMELPRHDSANHLYSAFQHLAQSYEASPGIFEGSGGRWGFSSSGDTSPEDGGIQTDEGSGIITEA